MKKLPPPLVVTLDGITLVNDSQVGTKTRIARAITRRFLSQEFFYATTPDGAGAAAFAEACHQAGRKLTLVSSQPPTDELGPALLKAQSLGATIQVIGVGSDQLHIVEAEAANMANNAQGQYVDFDNDVAINIVAAEARKLNLNPGQVFSASARGAMARAYQKAWPNAEHYSIVVVENVSNANFGIAQALPLPEKYRTVTENIPFPCNSYYEARVWPMVRELADLNKKPLFWNPSGPN